MIPDVSVSAVGLVGPIGRGVALYVVLRALSMLLALAPLRGQTKAALQGVAPLFALLTWVGFAVLSIHQLLCFPSQAEALVVALVLLGCSLAFFGPLRDVFTGVFLRAGAVVREGDDLQVGELRGHVEKLGQRGLLLRTSQGDAVVPYSKLDRETLLRWHGERSVRSHCFRVRPVAGIPPTELQRIVQEAALLSHWSCPSRTPEVISAEEGRLEVTVFAITRDGGPEIERSVRARLGDVQQSTHHGEAFVPVMGVANSQDQHRERETGSQ